MRRLVRSFAFVLLSFYAISAVAVSATAAPPGSATSAYPIALTSAKQLNEIGLALDQYDEDHKAFAPALANRCYVYGMTSTVYLMSFGDAFLAPYKKLGFSKESLCLALVSQAQYDPETGKRLPSYVIRDEAQLQRVLDGPRFKGRKPTPRQLRELSSEYISDELPLAVPHCFKNGTPYLDCNFRFGLMSGVPVRPETAKRWRAFGEAWDRRMAVGLASGKLEPSRSHEEAVAAGYLQIGGYWAMGPMYEGEPVETLMPDALWQFWTQQTWTVLSPDLPRGYGYALNATGELGERVANVRLAETHFGRRLSPQVLFDTLRRAVGRE